MKAEGNYLEKKEPVEAPSMGDDSGNVNMVKI